MLRCIPGPVVITAGFIQKLPTQLVAAFRATLEEIQDASLLLHVVDASHTSAAAQVDAVNKVLKELDVVNVPTITVWNKVDACANPAAVAAVASRREGTVCVSALTGGGIDELLAAVGTRLEQAMVLVKVLIPYSQGDLVDEVHRSGVVKCAEYTEHGTEVEAHVPPGLAARLAPLRTDVTLSNGASNGSSFAVGRDGDEEVGWDSEEDEVLEFSPEEEAMLSLVFSDEDGDAVETEEDIEEGWVVS